MLERRLANFSGTSFRVQGRGREHRQRAFDNRCKYVVTDMHATSYDVRLECVEVEVEVAEEEVGEEDAEGVRW